MVAKKQKKSLVKKKHLSKKTITIDTVTKEYATTLASIKKRVQEAQVRASLAANKELLMLYWSIGKIIVEKQKKSRWGSNLIERLAKDLQNLFPGISGFSRANIFRMRSFNLAYEACEKVSVAPRLLEDLPIFSLPWWHNVTLLTKLKNTQQRIWYAQKALEYGWSNTMLEHWIKTNLYKREGKALTNFVETLPKPHSDLAHQSLKDPYLFDFLTLHKEHLEKELEQGLIDHIQKFLLELGQGFAFLGRQVHIEVEGKDFYIDLLFYHAKLHCYLVIELKTTEFDPRDTGQISFYLAAVDAQLKQPDDKPTIGLLLCQSKKKLIVEYALRSNISPIGVATYETKLVESLPKNLKNNLPTVQEIEAELSKQESITKKNAKQKQSKRSKRVRNS